MSRSNRVTYQRDPRNSFVRPTCAFATVRHHRQVGRSCRVDFDACDLLSSRQLRYQPTSARARLKDVIRCRYCYQNPHSVRQGFGCFKRPQTIS